MKHVIWQSHAAHQYLFGVEVVLYLLAELGKDLAQRFVTIALLESSECIEEPSVLGIDDRNADLILHGLRFPRR